MPLRVIERTGKISYQLLFEREQSFILDRTRQQAETMEGELTYALE
jgi:hypothetical protein